MCHRAVSAGFGRGQAAAGRVVERFGKSAAKAVACHEEGFEGAMAVMVLPDKYRRRTRTTDMQERLNKKIRRRERTFAFFPMTDQPCV